MPTVHSHVHNSLVDIIDLELERTVDTIEAICEGIAGLHEGRASVRDCARLAVLARMMERDPLTTAYAVSAYMDYLSCKWAHKVSALEDDKCK